MIERTPYTNLRWLYQNHAWRTIHRVYEIYTIDGKYGKFPMLRIDGYMVDLPKELMKPISIMLEDDEFNRLLKAGKVGIIVESYTWSEDVTGKKHYTIKWEYMGRKRGETNILKKWNTWNGKKFTSKDI